MSIFGARVKTLRLDRGWSMKQLGEEISKLSGAPLPQTTVSNWENKGSEPPYNILVFTATALEVSTDYLLGKTDELQFEQHTLKNAILTPPDCTEDAANINNNSTASLQNLIQELKHELNNLPINKKESIENDLNEYLEFLGYKQEKLLVDFKTFSKYIKYQIKNL
ncbi:MerR family transcriptional regulator [Bacillus thuringiensis]|uniref:Helix-turn-helix domain-containing protein n=1 Tax=Bacillus thuringiensis TaxID=1428 RepID=A0A437S9S3_BACTU|nr:helix-turn-helix transcriptional regulator [Bacillus thuringiensis]MBG9536128.1 MerR family transcriptional regulator [Bacillus thuringiensis]MBG9585494.1 MerR family transcriptional regulator [Bacillus thuringiensis]MDY0855057.1 helix-turn-helix domain-containing protein [Bacillus thuringiensis]MDY4395136.1 helix-turn-helix domain-containing protein [Bacillus thuringiensis]MDY7965307.1 helix-turn-helix domain-containing protein [Bacillus thuringiensis]